MIANFHAQVSPMPIQHARRFLFDPRLPLWKYCLIALPVALVPSIFLAVIAHFTLVWLGVDVEALKPPDRSLSGRELFGSILMAPVCETLILAGVLAILSIFLQRDAVVALASALLWGALHGAFGAMWFFGTVWSFYVFSCAYLYWRKQSFAKAFVAASLPHALINSAAMLSLFFVTRG
jgi:hypothetical protein